LEVAECLSRSDETLDEALEVLRPLLDVKGAIGAKAQELHRKISKSPALRGSQRDGLVAFEEAIGVGTAKLFDLRVAHTGHNYLLADINDRPAPRFYDHKYLRVMIKADELPKDLPFAALKKGDTFKAPVRGQDADPKKDKNPRLYWVADPSALTTELTVEGLNDRLRSLESKFGVGTGDIVRIKVGWDPKRKELTARLFGKKGKAEFPLRPQLKVSNLPEGIKPDGLGRGKRAWGLVEVEEGKTGRRYLVQGTLSFEEPKQSQAPSDDPKAAIEPENTATVAAEGASGDEGVETPPDVEGAKEVLAESSEAE
tara:strand:- start:619 stop:1557 length:939 start_codon:yes stop_codon:yes gene_type:complete